jgi:hypothetical protein
MAKRHKRRKQAHPEEVLSGAMVADAHRIIDLIRQVNPTGADLSPSATADRYRQKSALQSRLILDHHERLSVVPDPHQDGLVTLYYEGRDACHAVLSELDHDARAWAQRYLDEGTGHTPRVREAVRPPPSSAAPEPEPDLLADDARSAAELTAAADEALERYDYPAAGALLHTALGRPGADAHTARAYLTLLVDTLGDAEGALAAAARLPKAALADTEVRGLLGEAAARLGDAQRASAYLKSTTGPRAGAAYRALCAAASAAGDVEGAQAFLDEARQRDDEAHAEWHALAGQIDRLRRQAREPAERELERLLGAGERDAARAAAQACLARWPDSRVARGVLDRIQASERQEAIHARLEEARQAQRQGDHEEALAHYQQALDLGCPPEALGEGYRTAQAQVTRHNEAAETARITALLAQADPSEGLLAYLQAPRPVREGLRAALARGELDWLDALSPPASGAKARAAVEAVSALAQARQALAEGAADRAQTLLAGHHKALEGLAAAQEARQAIERRRAAAQREEAAAHLARAREAARAGHMDTALAALDQVPVHLLGDGQRQEAEALRAELRRAEHRRLLRERTDDLLAQGDALGARAALDELARLSDGDEAQRLRGERERVDARIRREWTLPIALDPDAEHILASLDLLHSSGDANPWLVAEDGRLVVACPVHDWLLIATLDATAGHVLDHALLRAPEPFRPPVDLVVHGQRASVLDEGGRALTLSVDGWRIEAWAPLGRFMDADERRERMHHLPGARFCWLESARFEANALFSRMRVLDLQQQRVHRELPEGVESVIDIQGAGDAYLVVDGPTQRVSRYAATGKPLAHLPGLDGHVVSAAAALPGREEMLTVSYDADPDVDPNLVVSVLMADGRVSCAHPIADSCGEMINATAVRRNPTLAFVLYRRYVEGAEDEEPCPSKRLLALEVLADGLAERYDVPAPPGALLLTDTAQRRVTLLWYQPNRGVQALPLDAQPPAWPQPLATRTTPQVPAFAPPFLCAPGGLRGDKPLQLPGDSRHWEEGELSERMRAFRQALPPAQLPAFVKGLLNEGLDRAAQELVEQAREEGDLAPAMAHAEWLFDKEAWDAVCALLTPRLAPALADKAPDARHLCHMLGLAHYRAGRLARAAEVWRSGLECEGTCPLAALLEVADYFLRDRGDTRPEEAPSLTRLLADIHRADRLLAQDRPGAAADALDTPDVWATAERQSLARLTLAWLRRDAAGPRADAIRLLAAGRYLDELRSEHLGPPKNLHFPAAWDSERLFEVGRMAKAWLEEPGRTGEPHPRADPCHRARIGTNPT